MSQSIDVTSGGLRWRLHPELRDQLLGERGLRLAEWLQAGQAHVVKHAPHRTVYRVRLPGLTFYLKHNRLPDTQAWLRGWLRRGKALSEYERALAVAARHIPTFTPLAVGEPCQGKWPGESFLLTQALEDTQPLNTFLEQVLPGLPANSQTRLRQRIAVSLGHLIADMHDAGIVHDDLHTGNILIDPGPDGLEPRLYLIDLDAVRLGPRLEWAAARNNLVILNRWFVLRSSRSDRLRFWHAYCARRRQRASFVVPVSNRHGLTGCVCPTRPREVEKNTLLSNIEFWHGLDSRSLGNNRRFRRLRAGEVAGHAVADLAGPELTDLLADPDAPFRVPGVLLHKDSRSSTVAELDFPVGGTSRRVIYKRFRVTSRLDPWLALFRPAPARRSWVNGHSLRLRWLPTPRPLAVFHRRQHGLPCEGYLLTAKVEGAEDLHLFMDRIGRLPEQEYLKAIRDVLEKVACLVRDMHARGVSHRDLKAVNLLVVHDPTASQAASADPIDHWPLTSSVIWLIDLVGVRLHRRLGMRRKVQNLARLNASFVRHPGVRMTDRLRFLRIYLQCGLRQSDWKSWWRRIERVTRAKVARNARNGRPLA
jgi:tRNA A-37 threonylcarbamoyl transferase component Bud32